MKTLIAYFSLSGNTKRVAERMQALAGGDLFEIKAKKNYGSYARAIAIGGKEIATREMPAVTTHVDDFASYDRILLGFPVWYGTCPRLIRTFASEYDFTGKDVYVFCTSGSTGPEKSGKAVKEICGGASVHTAIRISDQDDDAIRAWLEQ
ncbi:MAG: flavodoxin [Clostridiales bacterium]|nr:flavodoxin [Clostridiales bacterium]MCD8111147.1 flavodoxin [Clostridiales bacterium]MCD8132315.1 flavodoxin [Clostridiales bacterium]